MRRYLKRMMQVPFVRPTVYNSRLPQPKHGVMTSFTSTVSSNLKSDSESRCLQPKRCRVYFSTHLFIAMPAMHARVTVDFASTSNGHEIHRDNRNFCRARDRKIRSASFDFLKCFPCRPCFLRGSYLYLRHGFCIQRTTISVAIPVAT